MTSETNVVVGAGVAGAKAVEAMRASGFSGRIVLVGVEEHLPYERPELSKGFLRGTTAAERLQVLPRDWYDAHDVTLLPGRAAVLLDGVARTVTLDDSRELGWDRLLLATGATPRRLVVEGAELEGVHHVRTLEDATALRADLRRGGRLVVVGAGWLGMEVAAAARAHGASVTVVEQLPTPLYLPLGPEIGELVAQVHRGHGVDIRTDVGVEALPGDSVRVREVLLTDGSRLPADAVVVAIGATPNDVLAETAGLAVDDGVLVDSLLRSIDHPDVYAAGDVARAWSPAYGVRLRVDHSVAAAAQGAAAGRVMAGGETPYDAVPCGWSEQFELSLEHFGWVGPAGYDQVVFRGDDGEGEDDESMAEFVAFWLLEGRVQAALTVNTDRETAAVRALVTARSPVEAHHLADAGVPLGTISHGLGTPG